MVYTFGSNKPKEIISPTAEIYLETKRGLQKRIRVNVVPHITNSIPILNFPDKISVDVIADDDSLGDKVNVLIGNNYYFSFIRGNRRHIGENLYLIDTDFGWMLTGSTDGNIYDNALSIVTYCQCHGPSCPYFTEPDLPLRNVDMKFLWALESIGITDSPKTTREEEAVKFFNDTIKYVEGRYEVKWPWIQFPPEIPTNYKLSYGRLKSLLKRSDSETLTEFDRILSEQLEANIIEVIEPQTVPIYQVNPPIHYLPGHIVKQEGKRGRIVYDASAKVKDYKSLNECMYRGPSMLEDLTALLLKFRCGEVGITADIEKAFLQVGLQDEDRDVTRFLWVKDLSKEPTEDNILHYRFCRVPFGIISSPFLLTATIRHHLSQDETLLKNIADRCYVDNLVTCAEDYNKATTLYEETRKVFKELGMNIREWMSNDKHFLETIPEPLRAPQKDRIKVLGLMWNVEKDNLELKFNDNSLDCHEKVTKRDVLRTLARVYDPCGFASPLILPAKIFFQQLCEMKIKWDTNLSTDLIRKWSKILDSLKLTRDIEIPRHVGNVTPKSKVKYELHTFTDASMKAYAAVTYLRIVGERENKIAFLMSKARITPLEDQKDLKIPRLELLAYLIGSRLMKYVKANIDLPVQKQYLWTDSQVVLGWIKSNKLLSPFITRRVNEIKENKGFEFRYVDTNRNPADLATRPELWESKKGLWFKGPEFLSKEPVHWPSSTISEDQQAFLVAGEGLDIINDPEMSVEDCEKDIPDVHLDMDLDGQIAQEQENAIQVETDISGDKTHLTEIINLQKEHFPEEVSGKETHLTRNLGLYLDVDGLLRSRGRLSNTRWSYDMKHPILLPPKSSFTDKVIRETHVENYHVGVPHTLNIIREKYWIPQGRAQVQRVLKTCNQCIKQGGGPYRLPPTPALPVERANYSDPYTYTGLDYFGPVLVATKLGKEKRWVCLYTCLAVRAVHMEVVKDLTAEECLLALRRFIASRGKPTMILSDNATQFKLTSELLTNSYCVKNSIKWKFIPQLAPWHGGVYERLVALAKHCMKRTLEKHLLNDNQLLTVIKEIEAVINTRPLTYVGADLDRVLRPVDFLRLGNCVVPEPMETDNVGKITATKVDLIASWKRGTMILGEFKDMFIKQYLTSLREKHRYSVKQPRSTSDKLPQVGDMVQIFDDSKKRINWKEGKITTLIKSQDGHCRVAKVKVGDMEFTRSIGHLYPLETDCSVESAGAEIPVVERMDLTLPTDHPNIRLDNILPENSLDLDNRSQMQDNMEVPNEVHSQRQAEAVQGTELSTKESEVTDRQEETVEQKSEDTPQEQEQRDLPAVPADARPERIAAQRAREKIAEWTRHLAALL
ncbi:uncharacterized protein LOC134675515 [Cydia fagiglandana]|uniref:uncharacterized protein LOC134675515 n=1 Tax=Cydia fagiglandana TaxID=1458189 RepID=UPI002FEE2202